MIDPYCCDIFSQFLLSYIFSLLTFLLCWNVYVDGVPKEGLRIEDVLVRIAVLLLIREKVSSSNKFSVFSLLVFSILLLHYAILLPLPHLIGLPVCLFVSKLEMLYQEFLSCNVPTNFFMPKGYFISICSLVWNVIVAGCMINSTKFCFPSLLCMPALFKWFIYGFASWRLGLGSGDIVNLCDM